MNEAGPVAAFDPTRGGHVLLQHRLLVEVLDERGQALPRGERGEVTLTGGFNFCLPLLRYRTGDFAALEQVGGEPVLVGLDGRAPVRFRTPSGEWLNNIEITHALRSFELRQFHLHQAADGTLRLRVLDVSGLERELSEALRALFGPGQRLEVSELGAVQGKLLQYSSELSA